MQKEMCLPVLWNETKQTVRVCVGGRRSRLFLTDDNGGAADNANDLRGEESSLGKK